MFGEAGRDVPVGIRKRIVEVEIGSTCIRTIVGVATDNQKPDTKIPIKILKQISSIRIILFNKKQKRNKTKKI